MSNALSYLYSKLTSSSKADVDTISAIPAEQLREPKHLQDHLTVNNAIIAHMREERLASTSQQQLQACHVLLQAEKARNLKLTKTIEQMEAHQKFLLARHDEAMKEWNEQSVAHLKNSRVNELLTADLVRKLEKAKQEIALDKAYILKLQTMPQTVHVREEKKAAFQRVSDQEGRASDLTQVAHGKPRAHFRMNQENIIAHVPVADDDLEVPPEGLADFEIVPSSERDVDRETMPVQLIYPGE